MRRISIFSMPITLSVILCWGLFQNPASAADGDPIAIQRWPGKELAIETRAGLRVLIQSKTGERLTDQNADIALLPGTTCDHRLFRKPNEEHPIWQRTSAKQNPGENALIAKSIRLRPLDQTTVLWIEVDGVSILVVPPSWGDGESAYGSDESIHADVLILPSENLDTLKCSSIKSLVESLDPHTILFSGFDGDDDSFETVVDHFGPDVENRVITHNTLAVSSADNAIDLESEQPAKLTLVRMGNEAWQMPDDLAALFDAMDEASNYSQRVFTQLSVNRMNFKPSNGTHTPRWNAEHMVGRQLLFFSKIFHAIDPVIPVIDSNPKQMPVQYEPAHPTWDGAEEARQMKLAGQFCRRYAYLLDGIDVDDKPPAVRWPSLRALLVQMDRHYREHTANVVQKFELPDWPAEEVTLDSTLAPRIAVPPITVSPSTDAAATQ